MDHAPKFELRGPFAFKQIRAYGANGANSLRPRPASEGGPFQSPACRRAGGDPDRQRQNRVRMLLEDEREEIVTAVITAAKAGDSTAMKLCFECLMPLRKGVRSTSTTPALRRQETF
jgi:hypothetical protein